MEITNYCKKLMQFTRILNGFFRKCKKSLKAKNLQIENYIIFKVIYFKQSHNKTYLKN